MKRVQRDLLVGGFDYNRDVAFGATLGNRLDVAIRLAQGAEDPGREPHRVLHVFADDRND